MTEEDLGRIERLMCQRDFLSNLRSFSEKHERNLMTTLLELANEVPLLVRTVKEYIKKEEENQDEG
jgi:hypothetical protein